MKTEASPERKLEIDSARAKIVEISQQIAAMGGNDHEFWDLQQITERLSAGQIDPEEAVVQARKVLENKQDYH